jgi:tRNA-dihydrouridine synthase B
VLQLGPLTISEPALLAPMAGLTDIVFRRLCQERACGMVFTELVRAECLARGDRRAMRMVETTPQERPMAVQLYHSEPEVLAEAARRVEAEVPCDAIDLNMGCPVGRVVSRGAGAALMRDPALVERLVAAVVNAVDLPVTAKTRAGWDDASRNAPDVARAVEAGGAAAITIHARTREQGHQGPVDFELLAKVREAVLIPVVGNGGIRSAREAVAMRQSTGVDAVMVGRGAIGNPWLFDEIAAAWCARPSPPPSVDERVDVVARHLQACADANLRWAHRDRDRTTAMGRAVRYIRGHLVGYFRGSPGERAAIRSLNGLNTPEQVLDAVREAWLPRPGDPPGPTEATVPFADSGDRA